MTFRILGNKVAFVFNVAHEVTRVGKNPWTDLSKPHCASRLMLQAQLQLQLNLVIEVAVAS